MTSPQRSNIQVTITVTYLNFAVTGSRILLHPLSSSRRGKVVSQKIALNSNGEVNCRELARRSWPQDIAHPWYSHWTMLPIPDTATGWYCPPLIQPIGDIAYPWYSNWMRLPTAIKLNNKWPSLPHNWYDIDWWDPNQGTFLMQLIASDLHPVWSHWSRIHEDESHYL